MKLSLIVAVAENGCIGRDGALPWHLPADLRRFKAITTGSPIIMGRKTHESIGKALPGRDNIVVTRQPDYAAEGCIIVHSLSEALEAARETGANEAYVIGGAALFAEALPLADTLHLTQVHAEVPGDVYLPSIGSTDFQLKESTPHASDERHEYPYTFEVWQRIIPG